MIFYYKANNKVTKPQEKYVPGMGMCWEFTMLPFKDKEEEKEADEYKELHKALTYEAKTDISEYYDELQGIIDTWKEEYRDLMV